MRFILVVLFFTHLLVTSSFAETACLANPSAAFKTDLATGDVEITFSRGGKASGNLLAFSSENAPESHACDTLNGLEYSENDPIIETGPQVKPAEIKLTLPSQCGKHVSVCFYPCKSCGNSQSLETQMIKSELIDCARKRSLYLRQIIDGAVDNKPLKISVENENAATKVTTCAQTKNNYICQIFDDKTKLNLSLEEKALFLQRWEEDCTGSESCQLLMNADRSVTAFLTKKTVNLYWRTKLGNQASGTVTPSIPSIQGKQCKASENVAGYSCGVYPQGVRLEMTASAHSGSKLTSWLEGCTGNAPSCTLTLLKDTFVTAQIDTRPTANLYLKAVNPNSGDAVSLAPIGGACPDKNGFRCYSYFIGTEPLVLTASTGANSKLTSWGNSSCDNNSTTCSILLTGNQEVTATFEFKCAPNETPYKNPASSPKNNACKCSDGHTREGISCVLCPAGKFINAGNSCVACPAGQVSPTAGQSSCVACPTEGMAPNSTRTACLCTGPGTVPASDGMSCSCQNEFGWYPSGKNSCKQCEAGSFLRISILQCLPCPEGSISEMGAVACTPCLNGLTSNKNRTACIVEPILTVKKDPSNTGTGTVTVSPTGSCDTNCSEKSFKYPDAPTVTLTAVPGAGSMFVEWTSPNSTECAKAATCVVSTSAAKTLVAKFNKTTTLKIVKEGRGEVGDASIPVACNANCGTIEYPLPSGTAITLKFKALDANVFEGWSVTGNGPSSCADKTKDCQVTMSESRTVTAIFKKQYKLTVTKSGLGTGKVTSLLPGIDCGATCVKDYPSQSTVILNADPSSEPSFGGWQGACSGKGPCSVNLSQDQAVTATFNKSATIAVKTAGNGFGSVTFEPSGTACTVPGTAVCNSYLSGGLVKLIPVASPGSVFSGWETQGGCSGKGVCMTEANSQTVIAKFNPTRDLTLLSSPAGLGSVAVSPPGEGCGPSCWRYESGTAISVSAVAGPGAEFAEWTSQCGKSVSCTFNLNSSVSMTAIFAASNKLTVISAGGAAGGVVQSSDGAISCGSSGGACSKVYSGAPAPKVTLSASPSPGYVFAGWSSPCNVVGSDCEITMSAARTVNVRFNPTLTWSVSPSSTGAGTLNPTKTSSTSCGASCYAFPSGTSVTLKATPNSSSRATTWSGGNCASGDTCTVTLDTPLNISVKFEPLSSGTCSGVNQTGNYCTCTKTESNGTRKTCNVTPAPPYPPSAQTCQSFCEAQGCCGL